MRDCENCKHYVEKVEVGKGSSPEHYFGCDSWECEFDQKGMTREEAIKIFNEVLIFGKATCTQAEFEELAKMSIQALEQEPQTFKWCTDCREYDQEKHCCHRWSKVIRNTVEEMKQEYIEREVLDKIRAEIIEKYWDCDICKWNGHTNIIGDISDILQILDKYNVEKIKADMADIGEELRTRFDKYKADRSKDNGKISD